MDNITAKMSTFARAYHYNNIETYVFADSKAEMILGDVYEKIAASLAQGRLTDSSCGSKNIIMLEERND